MSETVSERVHDRLGDLRRVLDGVPADERRDKAIYHLERLRMAFDASHQEAVRFAAYTLNKAIRDSGGQWPPDVAAAMDAVRAARRDAGHEF